MKYDMKMSSDNCELGNNLEITVNEHDQETKTNAEKKEDKDICKVKRYVSGNEKSRNPCDFASSFVSHESECPNKT